MRGGPVVPLSRVFVGVALLILAIVAAAALHAQGGSAVGGFVEPASSTAVRPAISAAQAQALLPARGPFAFPPPYGTIGVRLTNATDCGGQDCVRPVGYSYWANINNHMASDTMLVFLGLDRLKGGGGPTLFSIHKPTGTTQNLGAIFPGTSPLALATGEGWYFSRTRPHALYVNDGVRLMRHDVMLHTTDTIFDVRPAFGVTRSMGQTHSSNDDRVHSATLRESTTSEMLGCVVYREDTAQWLAFPKLGEFDECQIDKSGKWLVIKENLDGRFGEDNRVIDLASAVEYRLLDEQGAAGHSDVGYGYMVAEDNFHAQPGAVRLWRFEPSLGGIQGGLVYHLMSWASGLGHVAHGNARPGVGLDRQVVCSSNASRLALPRANEIVCYRIDYSQNALVVAPNLTDLNATGGGADDYSKMPKGNLDITGEYFVWTANAGTSRLDAFLVRVPLGQLGVGPPPLAPQHLLATVNGTALALSWTYPAGGAAPGGLVLNVSGSIAATFPLPLGETFSYPSVPPGTYTLTLAAANADGAGAASNAVTVTVPSACTGVPGPPRALQAASSGTSVSVSWLPPSDGGAVTNYTLLVAGAWTGGIPTTSRALQGTVPPGTYNIRVVASNACGTSPATAPQTVVIP